MVHHSAAREDHVLLVFGNGHLLLFPMHQVFADGVTPAHVAPFVAVGVVLVEHVVFTVVVYQPVGVVHPVLFWGEVELRTERLLVRSRGCRTAGFC